MASFVVCYPGLQKAGFEAADRASTIDEVLNYVPDLGNVEIGRNRVPVWKDQAHVEVGVLAQVILEGREIHTIIGIYLNRNMQAEFIFRVLRSSDYDAVVDLWGRCDGVEVAEGDDPASFSAYLERNPGMSFCAEANNVIVGAALCGHDGRRGLVYHLAVDAKYRGQGIGQEILRLGFAALKAQGISRVLILVAKDNESGLGFWQGRGFEAISGALPLGMDLL